MTLLVNLNMISGKTVSLRMEEEDYKKLLDKFVNSTKTVYKQDEVVVILSYIESITARRT